MFKTFVPLLSGHASYLKNNWISLKTRGAYSRTQLYK